MNPRVLLSGAAVLVVAGAVLLVHNKADQSARLAAPTPISVVVHTRRLEPGPVSLTLHAIAQVQATREIVVNSRMVGYVRSLPLSEGEHFRRGAVLARIEPTARSSRDNSVQAELGAATATLDAEEERLQRVRELYKTALVSTEQLQSVEASVASVRARVINARESLSNTVVVAPFAGVVSRRMAQVGDLVAVERALLKINDASEGNRLFVDVPESMRPVALLFEDALLPLQEWPEATFDGSRRYEARTASAQVTAGSRVPVRVQVFHSPAAIMLPSECVIAGDGSEATVLMIPERTGALQSGPTSKVAHGAQFVRTAAREVAAHRPPSSSIAATPDRVEPRRVTLLARGDEGSAVAPTLRGRAVCASPDILLRVLAGAAFRALEE